MSRKYDTSDVSRTVEMVIDLRSARMLLGENGGDWVGVSDTMVEDYPQNTNGETQGFESGKKCSQHSQEKATKFGPVLGSSSMMRRI